MRADAREHRRAARRVDRSDRFNLAIGGQPFNYPRGGNTDLLDGESPGTGIDHQERNTAMREEFVIAQN